MATKTGKGAVAKPPAAKRAMMATFTDAPDKAKADALAVMALKPSANAAAVIVEYTKPFGEQDIGAVMSALSAETKEVWAGDLRRAEAMLFGQAHALQAIFMNFSRRASNQEYQKNLESFLRMGLKAQNQCRMTLETLAAMKNPPVVFARQANIAHGPQQVNNGVPSDASHATKKSTVQTELLEASDGQRLDTRAASAASGADPHLEAVAPVHRAAKR